jgi:dTMP kinase
VSSNRFITFEGIEGSGKSTQVDRAARFLEGRGVEVVRTREPGGTAIGNALRAALLDPDHGDMAPLTELLIVYAARAQHIEEVIQPALDDGKVVLCDRYEDSTMAYQGYGRGIPLETIKLLSSLTTTGVKPGLTFLLDLPVEEGLDRARRRNENGEAGGEERLDRETVEFHRRVREGYRTLAEDNPGRFRVLNALLARDKVAHRVGRDLSLFLKLS